MKESSSSKEAESIFDILICTYYDFATAETLIRALRASGSISAGKSLDKKLNVVTKLREADFNFVKAIAYDLLDSKAAKDAESFITLQSIKWALHKGHAIPQVLDEVDKITNPIYAAEASVLLISPENVSEIDLQNAIVRQIYEFLFGVNELQKVLNFALQFKDLLLSGRQKASYRADMQSYVYVSAYARFIYSANLLEESELQVLQALCTHRVRNVNQFGSSELTSTLLTILEGSMRKWPQETVELLYSYPAFSTSMRHCTGWTPLGNVAKSTNPKFDYLSEYLAHANASLKPSPESSILDLGRDCGIALRRNGAEIFEPDSQSETIFPVCKEARLKSDVWSVCSDCVGHYALFGTSKGQLYIYNFRNSNYVQLVSSNNSKVRYDRPPGTERIKSHPNVPGIFAITGGGLLTVADVRRRDPKLVQYVVPSNSYGDICWHHADNDLLFYCNDAVEQVAVLRGSVKRIEREYPFNNTFMCMCNCGNSTIALLSAKIHKKPQVIVILNVETDQRITAELPPVHADGAYSTLVSSQWDKRTVMLVAQPNMIVLVDILGKRPLRVIYGPKQENFMIKAIFFGPMDKYILAASEEKSKTPKAWLINRFTGETVGYLEGHTNQINDVSFVNHPKKPIMLTGADDSRVLFHALQPMR